MDFGPLAGIQGVTADSFELMVQVLKELSKQPDINIVTMYSDGSKHFLLFTATNNKIKINLKGVKHVPRSR